MHEKGIIVEIINSTARIEMVRSPACKTCGLCTSLLDLQKMILEVESVPGAQVGDRVVVEIEPAVVMRSASILYLIPLAGLFIGVILGDILFHQDMVTLFIGLAGLLFAFGLVLAIERKAKKSSRFQPRIVEVIR